MNLGINTDNHIKILRFLKFQFYDSPIKSISKSRFNLLVTEFQFYDSPIKSLIEMFDML